MCAPPNWRNFDAGPAFIIGKWLPFLRPMLLKKGFPDYPKNIEYGDVITGLPVDPGSARAVYSSHVLEHLSLDEFRIALRNVYSYLAPGGVFRLVVPDLESLARRYLDNPDPDAASRFMEESYLGEKATVRGMSALPRMLFGRSKHFWMWDYKNFELELRAAGFTSIRRAAFGDSPDPNFTDVESPGRWEDCLGIECIRPA